MELSVRDAKARFSEVAEAASRGERVIVTRHGQPFIEMVPAKQSRGFDFERAAQISKQLGFGKGEELWWDGFDDPAFSRRVLGLE